jgi:DNA invertase Pin-like site-specific DNA recombinase
MDTFAQELQDFVDKNNISLLSTDNKRFKNLKLECNVCKSQWECSYQKLKVDFCESCRIKSTKISRSDIEKILESLNLEYDKNITHSNFDFGTFKDGRTYIIHIMNTDFDMKSIEEYIEIDMNVILIPENCSKQNLNHFVIDCLEKKGLFIMKEGILEQNEVKQNTEVQNEVKQNTEVQNEVKQNTEVQNEVKQNTESELKVYDVDKNPIEDIPKDYSKTKTFMIESHQNSLTTRYSGTPYDSNDDKIRKRLRSIIGYCRVSTTDQVEKGMSIDVQHYNIREYAYHKGINIKCITYDNGISAKEVTKRKGLKVAMSKLEEGDIFVVSSLSRLARNIADSVDLNKQIKDKRCSLVVLDMNIDTQNPVGQMIFNVMSSLNQFEREQVSARVSHVISHLSATGKLKTKPPYGWKAGDKGKPFVKDEQEQKNIEFIRKLKEDNPYATVSHLCMLLDKEPHISKRKAKRWHCTTLLRIMQENKIPVHMEPGKKIEPFINVPNVNQ